MIRTISAHDARTDAPHRSSGRTHTKKRIERFAYWLSSSLKTHVRVGPISRRSTSPLSARSLNQRYAFLREHPTYSATSLVPATPSSSRRASRKSSFDHEEVYLPVSSFRSGGTDCVLMPLSYGAYGIIIPFVNITRRFIPLSSVGHCADHRPLGAQWRARMNTASGPGFAHHNPMRTNGQSSLERTAYDANSGVSTINSVRPEVPAEAQEIRA
jgi:hypothetical protein